MSAFPIAIQRQFEEYLRQQGIDADVPYLEGREEAETEFVGKLGGFQERGLAAKEEYLKPDKTDTLAWILRGLGIALPVAGAIVGGRSTGSKKARGIMTGLGRAAGGFGQARRMGREFGKEREYEATMGQLENEYGMAKDVFGARLGTLGTERDVLESDRTHQLGVGRLGLAERKQDWAEEQPGRGSTWSDLKLKGFGALSAPEQKDALYPGLAPSKAGGLTESQREKSRQQDVLDRANMHLYSLDPEMRERAGIKYDIKDFPSLAEAAQALAKHRKPTGLFGWGEGEAAPDSTLYDLMIEYMGDQTGLGMGEAPLTPEEKAELEARRQRQ